MFNFRYLMLSLFATLVALPASAQEASTLDEKVNAAFASATGPFVNFIFASFPGTNFP